MVTVTAKQFWWTFEPAGPYPTDRQIEFALTSTDVNHGFGLYGPDGAFVLQAQVVPDATSNVRHTFHTTGRYTVRCLEYCGLAHHEMTDGFSIQGRRDLSTATDDRAPAPAQAPERSSSAATQGVVRGHAGVDRDLPRRRPARRCAAPEPGRHRHGVAPAPGTRS